MLVEARYTCPSCGEEIETAVDPSQGERQTYVEDCQVCCRPAVLHVTIRDGEAHVTAEPE